MWIFFLLSIAAAALAGQLIDVQQVPWRAVEVASILAGSLAIVAAVSEWRKLLSGNQAPHLKRRVCTARITLHSVSSTYLSIVRFRIENEASNMAEYREVLPWFERLAELATSDDGAEPESILSQNLSFPTQISDREIQDLYSELDSLVNSHEQALTEYRHHQKNLGPSLIDELVIFAMPYLISVAVSLALFKAIYQP